MYIAIIDDDTFKVAETLTSLYSLFLTVDISANGSVSVNGKTDTISYNMDEYTPSEAKDDFFRIRAKKFLPRLTVYRLEPIN